MNINRRFPWFAVGMALCALSQTTIAPMPPDQVTERKQFDPLPPRSRAFVRTSKKGKKKKKKKVNDVYCQCGPPCPGPPEVPDLRKCVFCKRGFPTCRKTCSEEKGHSRACPNHTKNWNVKK